MPWQPSIAQIRFDHWLRDQAGYEIQLDLVAAVGTVHVDGDDSIGHCLCGEQQDHVVDGHRRLALAELEWGNTPARTLVGRTTALARGQLTR